MEAEELQNALNQPPEGASSGGLSGGGGEPAAGGGGGGGTETAAAAAEGAAVAPAKGKRGARDAGAFCRQCTFGAAFMGVPWKPHGRSKGIPTKQIHEKPTGDLRANHRRPMQYSWGIYGQMLETYVRPMRSQLNYQPMGRTWVPDGRPTGDPWEIYGRPMGDPWTIHGRPMGNPWAKIHGKAL